MKKTLLILVVISALFTNCKETVHKEVITDGEEILMENPTHDINTETKSLDNSWVNEIMLDNGSKWTANPETTEGVDKMMNLIKISKISSVEDFHLLAKDLNNVKNLVVKECTMKGSSHDNLHVFLHPLIEKIEALGNVSSTEEGSEITAKIQENLENYYAFFQ